MTTSQRAVSIAAGAALALAVGVAWWLARSPHAEPAGPARADTSEAAATPPAVAGASADEADPASTAAGSFLPEPGDTSEQVAATRRMYTAHAPLREAEVADPDSAANREVLETMVRKALQRPNPADVTAPTQPINYQPPPLRE
jgi:hypothetical protein